MIAISPEHERRKKRRRQPVEVHVVVEIRMPQMLQQAMRDGASGMQIGSMVPTFSYMASVVESAPVATMTGTTDVDPASVCRTAAVPQSESPTLMDHYRNLLEQQELLTLRPSSHRANKLAIREFQEWLTSTRISYPRVGLSVFAQFPEILYDYARAFRMKETGNSEDSCCKAMSGIVKLCGAAVRAGLMVRVPKRPSRGEIVLMPTPTATRWFRDEVQGLPVTIDEFKTLKAVLPTMDLAWPAVGKVKPWQCWNLILDIAYYTGVRIQDAFPYQDREKPGLEWANILTSEECPMLDGVSSPHGWMWMMIHKTSKHDQKKALNPKLLLPIPSRIREQLELFRGVDDKAVMPLPANNHAWGREFKRIKEACGFGDAQRAKAGLPVIRISEGKMQTTVEVEGKLQQVPMSSMRKGCANMWADHVSEKVASYVLKHAVKTESSGVTTRGHYLDVYRPLKDITPAIETLPIWS